MKAKITGMSSFQGAPIKGTLTVWPDERYEDGEGNATPGRLEYVLDLASRTWRDAHNAGADAYVIVAAPGAPEPVTAIFEEVFEYADGRRVPNLFRRSLVAADLDATQFNYVGPQSVRLYNAGEPLTMQAARQLLTDGAALTGQMRQALVDNAQSRNEALATTGINPAYISETTADPPAAPDGTKGAKRDMGGNLVRLLRVNGAWAVAGLAVAAAVNIGSVSARMLGVGGALLSPTAAVNNALAHSAANRKKVVFEDDLTVDSTIAVPDGASLAFNPGARLRPSGDFTVLRIPSRLCHVRAIVDTTALPDYSSIAVEVDGSNEQFNRLRVEYLRIDMHSSGPANNTGSVGLAVRSNGGSVSFAQFDFVQVNNGCKGLLLSANKNSKPDGTGAAYGAGFVNGNQFGSVSLNGCLEYIVCEAELGEVAANAVGLYQVQCRTDNLSRRSILLRTKANTAGFTGQANGNRFTGMTWDWGHGVPDPVTGERIAIESPGGVNGTQGNVFTDPYLEYSGRVRISEFDTFGGSSYTRAPLLAGVTPPSSVQNRLATGLQDWALSGIHRDLDVTVTTSGPAPTTNAMNAFHVNPAIRTDWANLNAPYTYTLDFGANQQLYWDTLLVAFEGYRYCRGILIEYQDAQGGPWKTAFQTENNQQNVFVWQAPGWNSRYGIYGLRVTLSSPVDANGVVRLARLDAVIGGRGGKAWAPLADPMFLGTPTVQGPGGVKYPLLIGGKRVDLYTGGEALRLGAHPTDPALSYAMLTFAPRTGGGAAAYAGFTANNSTVLRWENTLGINRYVSTGTGNGHIFDGNVVTTPAAVQTITAAGTKINLGGGVLQLSGNAAYTLNATPAISDGYDGQRVTLLNVGASPVTLQDQGTLAGSNLRLTAATITLGPRHSVDLLFSQTVGDWVQVGPVVAVL